jgi:ABC-2 type transport system ATP-binding protein
VTHAVETCELTRTFGSLVAVDSLSFHVEIGDVFGLLGPNGAGKTTVIKMLTTLLPPTSGIASVAGADIVKHPLAVRRAIGYVPQLLSADGTLTGRENMLIFAKLYGMSRRDRMTEVPAALAYMGLGSSADKLVRQYSGGMIRRLEIAEAMLHRPQIVFLDEPTVGLDPVARQAVWDHIARLRADWGTTILLTTHYMEEADALCGRVTIMHHGRVVAEGSPGELKASIGTDGATLDEVFAHYTGDNLESGGTYRETGRTRRTARRLR